MSKKEKLLNKLREKPKDLTWKELTSALDHLGYREIQGDGSRVKFVNDAHNKHVLIAHKPHPGNVVKEYCVKYVVNQLTEIGLL